MSLTRSWLVAVLALGLATTTCGEGSRVAPAPGQVKTDIGVTHDTIKVGLLADLTGRFAVLASPGVDAQIAFWDRVGTTSDEMRDRAEHVWAKGGGYEEFWRLFLESRENSYFESVSPWVMPLFTVILARRILRSTGWSAAFESGIRL